MRSPNSLSAGLNESQSLQALRQPPANDQVPLASAIFAWPEDEIGTFRLESGATVLDEIRKSFRCHVVFDKALVCLKLYACQGRAVETVANALEAFKVATHEHVATTTNLLRAYLSYIPTWNSGTPIVKMTPMELSSSPLRPAGAGAPGRVGMLAELTYIEDKDDGHGWEQYIAATNRKTPKILALALRKSLDKLQYRRGRINIRVLLGVFVFTRYTTGLTLQSSLADDNKPAMTFMESMKNSRTEGSLYRLTPDSRLLHRVFSCADLFEVLGHGQSLSEQTYAFHTGVFKFCTDDRNPQAVVELRYITSPNLGPGGAAPRKQKIEWNTSVDSHRNETCLELFVTSLQPDLAFKFEITAKHCHREISQEHRSFSDSIQIMTPSACNIKQGDTELMFEITDALTRPKSFYQRTTWHFRLAADPNYVLEVSRLDRFSQEAVIGRQRRASGGMSGLSRKPVLTEWEACIFRSEWAENLAENLALKTGRKAQWDPSLETFFPTSGSESTSIGPLTGFERFVKLIQEITSRLGGVTF